MFVMGKMPFFLPTPVTFHKRGSKNDPILGPVGVEKGVKKGHFPYQSAHARARQYIYRDTISRGGVEIDPYP